jgi:hypothetical protein
MDPVAYIVFGIFFALMLVAIFAPQIQKRRAS